MRVLPLLSGNRVEIGRPGKLLQLSSLYNLGGRESISQPPEWDWSAIWAQGLLKANDTHLYILLAKSTLIYIALELLGAWIQGKGPDCCNSLMLISVIFDRYSFH